MARLSAREIDEIRRRYAAAPLSATGTRKKPGVVAAIAADFAIKSTYVIEIAKGWVWA
jgi:hypothetical protein